MMASTSSVYGANEDMPFTEISNSDVPLTICSNIKSIEVMTHSV